MLFGCEIELRYTEEEEETGVGFPLFSSDTQEEIADEAQITFLSRSSILHRPWWY